MSKRFRTPAMTESAEEATAPIDLAGDENTVPPENAAVPDEPTAVPLSLLPPVDEPVQTVPVSEPVSVAAPVPLPVSEAMPFLGVLCPKGMDRPSAGLPVVIRQAGVSLGVLVVSDPGYLGDVLDLHLVSAGYTGTFVQILSGQMDAATRYAAARAIVSYKGEDWNLIDRTDAVVALGFGLRSFA